MQINEILEFAKEIKKTKGMVYSNYYNKYNDSDSDYITWKGESTIVFLVPEQYVKRIFFYSSDHDELSRLLRFAPAATVIDYVSKTEENPLKDTIVNGGYDERAVYARFQNPIPYNPQKGDEKFKELLKKLYNPQLGEHAQIEDFEQIKSILLETFDVYNSDLLPDEDLLQAIKDKMIWIYKVNGIISTMYIYQIFGKKRYGAITYNKLSADYLYSLCKNADKESQEKYDIKWHYGWIDIQNNKIKRTMEKEGILSLDGVRNFIYEKKEEKND